VLVSDDGVAVQRIALALINHNVKSLQRKIMIVMAN
jgi:hypothetical protein